MVSVVAGRVSVEGQAPLEVSGQKQLSEGSAFFFKFVVGLVIGVGTCVILCCTHRSVSREIIVAVELIRSLPEGFWVVSL